MQGCKIYRLCIVADLLDICFRMDVMDDEKAKRICQRKRGNAPGRAQNLLAGCIFDRLACQKCFCVTFAESNKGCACRHKI